MTETTDTGDTASDGRVVQLQQPTPAELVLVCGRCGCMTHYIHEDYAECSNCSTNMGVDTSEWRRELPPASEDRDGVGDTGGLISNTVMSAPVLARKRVMKRISEMEGSGELAAVFAYANDGAGHFWMSVCTQDQKDWMLRRLAELTEYVTNMSVEGGE